MNGYSIIDFQNIDSHILFVRIQPNDVALTLKEVFESLSNLAWIESFDEDYIKNAFKTRAEATVKYIAAKIIRSDDDAITSDSGEYVISELARKTIVDKLSYLDIPLAELIKEKVTGNHGFDFYSENKSNIILFGEAKYNASQNAYGASFEQIVRFEFEKRDASDLLEVDRFCGERSKKNFSSGQKGFIAAFAAKSMPTDVLVNNIKTNTNFTELKRFAEIICVGVNI